MGQAIQTTAKNLSQYAIADLVDLPVMSDRTASVIVRLIVKSLSAAYVAQPEMFPLFICTGVDLLLKFGNSPLSAVFYSHYALILCGIVGDIETSDQMAELTLHLLAKFPCGEIHARAVSIMYALVKPWKTHTNQVLKPLLETYQIGLENGDSEYAAWCALTVTIPTFSA